MFFNRKYSYKSRLSPQEIRTRLMGRHTSVHGLDFEVVDTDHGVRVVPHAEQIETLKTLPVTRVDLRERGANNTDVILFAHMRRIDQGGPLLVLLFSLFMILAGIIGYIGGKGDYDLYTLPLIGVGILVFIIMWLRLEAGYFDYVRKVRDFVKGQIAA